MAIYSGNWKDPSGVPFDPGAFARNQYGGRTAQVRRTGRKPSEHLDRQRATARSLANIWLNVMTDAMRTEWGRGWAASQKTRDPDRVITTLRPFHSFAAPNWLTMYYHNSIQDLWPQISGLSIQDYAVISCTPAQLTHGFTVPDLPAQYEWTELAIFEIQPGRGQSTTKWRHTRMIYFEPLKDLDPGYHTRTSTLRWWEPQWTRAWFLFRTRTAHSIHASFYQSIITDWP